MDVSRQILNFWERLLNLPDLDLCHSPFSINSQQVYQHYHYLQGNQTGICQCLLLVDTDKILCYYSIKW